MNLKQIYAGVLSVITACFGIDAAKIFDAGLRYRKKLDLKNPVRLSDKVTWIELHDRSPMAAECTDKYAVRNYVSEKGLNDILVPLAGGPWDRIEDVDFDVLPDSFALKATHGCKMNYLVPNKNKMDKDACRKEMVRWMKTTYGGYSVEPHYKDIPHRIYAEAFLDNADQLIDYKFHCLNAKPEFVLVCSERESNGDAAMKVTLDLFDMEWNPIAAITGDESSNERPGNGNLERPSEFEEMKRIAEILSKDFKFVRVDLYEINGKIYFGELTFTPAGGVFPYFDNSFDKAMGELLVV